MTLLGLLLRLLLRVFGVIARESERPVGPPAAVTYPRPPRRAPDPGRVRSAMAQRDAAQRTRA